MPRNVILPKPEPRVKKFSKKNPCKECAGTGLEQNVPRYEAKICVVCKGSPEGLN